MREPRHDEGVRTRRIGVVDWIIAVSVSTAMLVTGMTGAPSSTALDWLGHLLLLVSGAVLIALRRAPVLVLVAVGVCALGYLAAGVEVPASENGKDAVALAAAHVRDRACCAGRPAARDQGVDGPRRHRDHDAIRDRHRGSDRCRHRWGVRAGWATGGQQTRLIRASR